jgi:uncharacterized protein
MRSVLSILLSALLCTALITCGCNRRTRADADTQRPTYHEAAEASPSPCSLPRSEGFVSDYAKAIKESTKEELETKLQKLQRSGQIDFSVVFIETTGQQSIYDYSLALARCWEVGATNPDKAGVLLVIAIKDRKWHIQITRVLEQVLKNEDVYAIGNQMTPNFKQGRYDEGANKCVDAMIAALAERRKFSIGATG